MKLAQFNTLDGAAWAAALPKARERRSGQAKRMADAVAAARLTEKTPTIPAKGIDLARANRRTAIAQENMNTAPTAEETRYWHRIWRARRKIADIAKNDLCAKSLV